MKDFRKELWGLVPEYIIDISPKAISIAKGGTQSFTANVEADETVDKTVLWSLSGNGSASTTVNEYTGVLTVASDETALELVVTATLASDESVFDTATVTVTGSSGIMPGDVNGDSIVGADDAVKILRCIVLLDMLTDIQRLLANVDGDDIVTALDASYILKKVAGIIDYFPVE